MSVVLCACYALHVFSRLKPETRSNYSLPGTATQTGTRSERSARTLFPRPSPISSRIRFGRTVQSLQQYEFTVAAASEIGVGAFSHPKEAQTAESEPSSPPTKVQARSLNRDSIVVQWAPPEQPNGRITVVCTLGRKLRSGLQDLLFPRSFNATSVVESGERMLE